jgi:phosphatidylglycerol:prolipoprotein diacylglycerol transferase
MVAFTIFWISIYRYGIFYAIAFILWYFWLARVWKRQRFKNYPKVQYFLTEGLEDFLLVIALGVVLWWRLGHVLIYSDWYYFSHPAEIIQVRKWWMSFIGGILWVVLCLWSFLYYKKVSRKDMLILFDIVLVFVPFGIFLWRFGNYLNQELYWIPITALPAQLGNILTSLWFSHVYSQVDKLQRVNTNFLSMALEWILILVVQIISFMKMIKKKEYRVWQLSTNFLLYYSIIRFFLEYLRADSQLEFVWFCTRSQRFFLFFIIISWCLKYYFYKKESFHLSLWKK